MERLNCPECFLPVNLGLYLLGEPGTGYNQSRADSELYDIAKDQNPKSRCGRCLKNILKERGIEVTKV